MQDACPHPPHVSLLIKLLVLWRPSCRAVCIVVLVRHARTHASTLPFTQSPFTRLPSTQPPTDLPPLPLPPPVVSVCICVSAGFDMGAVVPVAEPEWSGAHHGLCLYASRVLQAVWDEQVRRGRAGLGAGQGRAGRAAVQQAAGDGKARGRTGAWTGGKRVNGVGCSAENDSCAAPARNGGSAASLPTTPPLRICCLPPPSAPPHPPACAPPLTCCRSWCLFAPLPACCAASCHWKRCRHWRTSCGLWMPSSRTTCSGGGGGGPAAARRQTALRCLLPSGSGWRMRSRLS